MNTHRLPIRAPGNTPARAKRLIVIGCALRKAAASVRSSVFKRYSKTFALTEAWPYFSRP